ncbi:MAG TPA: PEP/pyruvate-binding domain-containing protein [Bacteroidales bacterium]|nr:PEP/pyruvate-binding domain-containing protein [Bacteroidales bacterium]HRZ48630.1 PEP/pyruvate-binding domain-containing protein [Bacteroidales bacterium]
MNKELQSKALEVNLAQTRDQEIVVPPEHQWFVSLSQPYWGIQKRVSEFFNELHHPYSNRKVVVEQLTTLVVGDFWLYKGHPERQRAYGVILGLFDLLLAEDLPDDLNKQLVYTFLSFIDNCTQGDAWDPEPVEGALKLLDKHLEENSFSYLSNLGYLFKSLRQAGTDPILGPPALALTQKIILRHISFWESTTEIETWYEQHRKKFGGRYGELLKQVGKPFFDEQRRNLELAAGWDDLVTQSFSFADIASLFRKVTDNFDKATEKFNYLFYLLHLPGMVYQRDYLLWDLNKVIRNISQELTEDQIIAAIDELFVLFAEFHPQYVAMVLDSVLTLGKEIINTSNLKLIHYFEDKVIGLGFVTPGLVYLTDDWQLQVDRNHVKNIRVWLELIEYGPEMMKKLLSALIINLRLGGIFIFDTDLFQRDVTHLLNADVSPIYKQIKQLTRIFPVYFNEIGAEGELRDVSTVIDEISQRNDKLIHFLRKQIHTEGNNSHIRITLEIIRFWLDKDTTRLKKLIPGNVMEGIQKDGIWVAGVHQVLEGILKSTGKSLEKILECEEEELKDVAGKLNHANESDVRRVLLIIKLYQLLREKYSFETDNIIGTLAHHRFFEQEDIEKLAKCLDERSDDTALKLIYGFMVKLNQVIFDPEVSQGWENIYYKRHIAFGIPSMYGQYHETKFEALGLTFRLERIATLLAERIIGNLNTDYITAVSLKEIYGVVKLLQEGLELDGISDQGLNSNLQMFQYSLTSGSFTVKQYINIFQFMEENVKEIINKYFIRPYDDLLKMIIPQLYPQEMKGDIKSQKKFIQKKSEIFYRDLLFSTFLIQHLDNFIGLILNNLRKMVTDLSEEDIRSVMSYDPGMVISPFYRETPSMDNQVFLGSKAYYLKKLYLKGYPVPPGFVLTTEVFRRKSCILKLLPLDAEIDSNIRRHIRELEELSGRQYGNPLNPLLLSVRSGSAISMPGAMNTFLNVGLNDEITETLCQQYNFGWTSWDCYRRLLQTWGMSYGLDRNDFDQIMLDYKQRYNVSQKIDFPPAIMREMAFTYKKLLTDNGIYFESDPFQQVKQAVISVLNSWETPRTNVYRNHMHIADEWGTAVIVQQMVFGNIHRESGSGVLFTHDPHDSIPGINLTGDFSFLSQGEDIVAGLVNTLPVSERQRAQYYQKTPFSLESAFPKIYNRLLDFAHELIEQHDFSHQEIEFTFETAEAEDLYILQTRDVSITKQQKRAVFSTPLARMKSVGNGIGIGNEVMNGLLAFDLDDINVIRERFPDQKSVLVRPDTVPDDIEMIFECDGLLTGKGGATSHAAVTAATLGKICVVNCTDLQVNEKEKTCTISDTSFRSFDPIAIDGVQGIIYKGNYPVKVQEL